MHLTVIQECAQPVVEMTLVSCRNDIGATAGFLAGPCSDDQLRATQGNARTAGREGELPIDKVRIEGSGVGQILAIRDPREWSMESPFEGVDGVGVTRADRGAKGAGNAPGRFCLYGRLW